jgi:ABC-type microcin C transport system permease subunit YejE
MSKAALSGYFVCFVSLWFKKILPQRSIEVTQRMPSFDIVLKMSKAAISENSET